MDIALSYQEMGSGEPLILLHGNGEDSSYFRHQIAHFQDRYRVIALDTRGHGKSPRGSAPFTIRQFARDLYDFMETRKIAEAVLLGFSDGANIAMRFAMEHPERGEGPDFKRGKPGPRRGKAEHAASHRDRLPDRAALRRPFGGGPEKRGDAGPDGE